MSAIEAWNRRPPPASDTALVEAPWSQHLDEVPEDEVFIGWLVDDDGGPQRLIELCRSVDGKVSILGHEPDELEADGWKLFAWADRTALAALAARRAQQEKGA